MLVQLARMIDIIRPYPDRLRLDFRNVLAEQFAQTGALARGKPGARIAIAVGSRGIANLQEIVSLVVPTVREKGAHPCIEHAVLSLALPAPAIVRISRTLDLERMQVSEMYIEEASRRSDFSMLGPPHEMEFDREGNLHPVSSPGPA